MNESLKDENIKNTTKLLNVEDLWIGNKNIETFFHNKVPALDFLNKWETAIRESEVPIVNNELW